MTFVRLITKIDPAGQQCVGTNRGQTISVKRLLLLAISVVGYKTTEIASRRVEIVNRPLRITWPGGMWKTAIKRSWLLF